MIRISAVYANTPGSRFDGDYYTGPHTRLASELLTPHGLEAIVIDLGRQGLDGSPPAYWAISEMRFASREAFDAGMAACGAALFEDAANYTDVAPVLQISERRVG